MLLETALSALVGLLGTGLTTYSNYKMKQLETDSKIRILEAESRNMRAEAEASIRVAETNAQLRVDIAEASAFQASMAAQKVALPSELVVALMGQHGWTRCFTYPIGLLLLMMMGIGDIINHLMRPMLTLYSLGIASWVTYQCWKLLPAVPSYAIAWESWQDACNIVMMLAVTMVTWWFGDRRVAKHLMHLKGAK